MNLQRSLVSLLCILSFGIQAKEVAKPKVLLVGDSISGGYKGTVLRILKGEADVVHRGVGTTTQFLDKQDKLLAGGPWDVIHFNMGLHDLCYRGPDSKVYGKRDKLNGKLSTTLDTYAENLDQIVTELKNTNATLIWANTTVVPEGEAGRKVGDDKRYNAVAAKVMNEHGIQINDLHAVTSTFTNYLFTTAGDVHYTPTGYQRIGNQVAAAIYAAVDPIPVLDPKGDVYKGEGENDPLIYDTPIGKKSMIIVYLDFPDQEMDGKTEERADKLLGEGAFSKMFHQQSYNKLQLKIDHVHGWRRMPKEKRAYDCATTEGHRDLFVDGFAKYPNVDFRTYDYIVFSMPGRGNFAFGERDDLAIPYRGVTLTVALNQASNSPTVLAHEVGHLMGLPDLYTYSGVDGPKNPAGPWDIMSNGNGASGFIGWHRHKFKWLGATRKRYLTKGTHRLTLTHLNANAGTSMIVVPVGDAQQPSKVFVVEIAQPSKAEAKAAEDAGPGVLIYHVDARIETGKNPVVVYPIDGAKRKAAFHAGDSFEDKDAPMTVNILKRLPDGSYEIDVGVKE